MKRLYGREEDLEKHGDMQGVASHVEALRSLVEKAFSVLA